MGTKPESVWPLPADVARAPAYLHCSVRAHGKEFCSLLHSLKRWCVVWDYPLSFCVLPAAALPPQQSSLSFCLSDTLASPLSITSS